MSSEALNTRIMQRKPRYEARDQKGRRVDVIEKDKWSRVLKPAVIGAAAVGLLLGVLGAGEGLSGAMARYQSPYKYATYVGGHGKANPKLSPVYIGVVNQRTATDSPVPQWTTGVKVALDYINGQADGVDGHPLEAIYCAVPTSVAAANSCGEEFADNSNISAVDVGVLVVGTTSLLSALAPSKKPIILGLGGGAVFPKAKDAFVLYGTSLSVEIPIATFAKTYLHVKSVSITYQSNTPVGVSQATVIDRALEYEGVKTVYKVGYTSHVSNLTEPFEAAHVGSTTLFDPINAGGPNCSDTYLTLKSLGATKTKVISSVVCDTPTVAAADGGQLPHDWYYSTANPLPGSPTKAVSAAEKVFSEYGKAAGGKTAWQTDAFGQILTNAKFDTEILKAGKKITPATVTATAKAFKGPMVNGPETEDCGGTKEYPAVCGAVVNIFENTSPGVMTPVAYDISGPKGFKA